MHASGIRRAGPDDAAAIAGLLAQLGYPADAAEVGARLRAMAALPRHAVFLALDEQGRVQGFIAVERRLMIDLGERAEITALVVDANLRRSGAGGRLVEAARQWACAQGGDVMMVRSNIVRAESHPFYEARGFVRRKTQHLYESPL